MDSSFLAGKIAIVTGAGKENGIGAGIALNLARRGARVAINYVSEATAERVVSVVANIEKAAGKGSVIVVQADIGELSGVQKLVNETLSGFGVDRIDILINNAAWAAYEPALVSSYDNVMRTFKAGVIGPLCLIQTAVPHMVKGGRVINIGSVASKLGIMPVYGAAKAAMDALTFSLARDIGRDGVGITINTLLPGPVQTDSLPPGEEPDKVKNFLLGLTRAEGRIGTVEDIADAVSLLCREESRWITGQVISASGGITGN
ncbi:hypothetical protein ACHAPE_000402 [Trichoderma viride]